MSTPPPPQPDDAPIPNEVLEAVLARLSDDQDYPATIDGPGFHAIVCSRGSRKTRPLAEGE